MNKKEYIIIFITIFVSILLLSGCSEQEQLNKKYDRNKKVTKQNTFREIISFTNNSEVDDNFDFYVDEISNNIYFKISTCHGRKGLSILYDRNGNPMKYKKNEKINPDILEYSKKIQEQEKPNIYKEILLYTDKEFGLLQYFVDTITDIVYLYGDGYSTGPYNSGVFLSVLFDDNGKPIKMHLSDGKINPKIRKYIPND